MTSTKSRSEMIREIRTSDRTYFVKNNTPNRVTCSTAKPPITLGPKGMGEDVAILSKSALDEPGFQRLWSAGKITLTDDPNVEEEMILSATANEERKAAEANSLSAMVEEPESNRDLIQKECLISGDMVYQTYAEVKNMVPPLAPAYKERAHEFTPTVSTDGSGNEIVKFSRATIEKE